MELLYARRFRKDVDAIRKNTKIKTDLFGVIDKLREVDSPRNPSPPRIPRRADSFPIEAFYDFIDIPLSPPMKAFRRRHLRGIDLSYSMGMEAFEASGDRSLLPHPGLVAHYSRGEYGQKTGKGWYDCSEE